MGSCAGRWIPSDCLPSGTEIRTRWLGEKLKYSLEIEVEGTCGQLNDFLHQLKQERPRAAVVKTEEVLEIDPSGATRFEIRSSQAVGSKTAAVLLVAW